MFTNALVVGFAIVIAAGPAAAQSKDPCSLLKAAEVQQVLGLKAHISDGVSSPPGGPGVAGCVYKWPDGNVEGSVVVLVALASKAYPGTSPDVLKRDS